MTLQSEPAPSSEAAEATEAAEEEEEPSEQEEEKGPAARLVARLGGPKAAKAKPKAAAKTSAKPPSNSASKGAAKVPGQPASAHQPASSTPKGAADKKAAEPAAQTLQLDGRGKRLKENSRESLAKHEEQAKQHLEVTFSLTHPDAKQIFSKKMKGLNSSLNSVTKQIKKITDSVNKGGFQEELDGFQKL